MRLAEQLRGADAGSVTKVVDVHISRLRAKLDGPFEKKLVHTVRRFGYFARRGQMKPAYRGLSKPIPGTIQGRKPNRKTPPAVLPPVLLTNPPTLFL
jgi:hypothetical protein